MLSTCSFPYDFFISSFPQSKKQMHFLSASNGDNPFVGIFCNGNVNASFDIVSRSLFGEKQFKIIFDTVPQ